MTTDALSWRPLTDDDVDGWSALTTAVSEVDDSNSAWTAPDLLEELHEPGVDPELDLIGVFDGERLVAVGRSHPIVERVDGGLRAEADVEVHPEYRNRGIGTELLARMLHRTRDAAHAAFPNEPVEPTVGTSQGSVGEEYLRKRGWRPLRYFHELSCSLPGDGARDPALVEYDPALEHEVWAAHQSAFMTHWGFAPTPYEEWRALRTASRTLRPACSPLYVVNGEVLGYVLSYELQPGVLYVGQVGVVPAARRQGWAARLLRFAIAAAGEAGYGSAELHVDSDNSDGAGSLYAGVGFHPQRAFVVYEHE